VTSFFSIALGPHPQRELTLMPRLGFPCPQLGMAAGAALLLSIVAGQASSPTCPSRPTCLLSDLQTACAERAELVHLAAELVGEVQHQVRQRRFLRRLNMTVPFH
jgi:hypothetical protein